VTHNASRTRGSAPPPVAGNMLTEPFRLLTGSVNASPRRCMPRMGQEEPMHSIIYLVGLVVVILAILSFFGLR
jgi:hypothetical protein